MAMPESEKDVDMGGFFGDEFDYDDEFLHAPSIAKQSAPKMSIGKEEEEEDVDMGGLFGDDDDYGYEAPQPIK